MLRTQKKKKIYTLPSNFCSSLSPKSPFFSYSMKKKGSPVVVRSFQPSLNWLYSIFMHQMTVNVVACRTEATENYRLILLANRVDHLAAEQPDGVGGDQKQSKKGEGILDLDSSGGHKQNNKQILPLFCNGWLWK